MIIRIATREREKSSLKMAETLERENFIYTTRRIIARTIHSAHCTTVERSRLSCNLDRIAVYPYRVREAKV